MPEDELVAWASKQVESGEWLQEQFPSKDYFELNPELRPYLLLLCKAIVQLDHIPLKHFDDFTYGEKRFRTISVHDTRWNAHDGLAFGGGATKNAAFHFLSWSKSRHSLRGGVEPAMAAEGGFYVGQCTEDKWGLALIPHAHEKNGKGCNPYDRRRDPRGASSMLDVLEFTVERP